MRSRIVTLGLLVLLALPRVEPAAGAPPVQQAPGVPRAPAYYALQMTGTTRRVNRFALNGQTLHEGDDLVALGPHAHYISRYLQPGRNRLDVEFISDPKKPMTMAVVGRGGDGQLVPLARFQAAAGESGGRPIVKSLVFSADVPAPVVVGARDRQEIANLLQTYYDALARRDAAAVHNFYAPWKQAYASIDPLHAAPGQPDEMYGNPEFRMKPYNSAGLQAVVLGRVVRVSRPGGLVMESEPLTVEATSTLAGGLGSTKVKIHETLTQHSFEFERIKGAWRFAVPGF